REGAGRHERIRRGRNSLSGPALGKLGDRPRHEIGATAGRRPGAYDLTIAGTRALSKEEVGYEDPRCHDSHRPTDESGRHAAPCGSSALSRSAISRRRRRTPPKPCAASRGRASSTTKPPDDRLRPSGPPAGEH